MFTAEFLITSLVVVLIPGTGVIFTVVMSTSLGAREMSANRMPSAARVAPETRCPNSPSA